MSERIPLLGEPVLFRLPSRTSSEVRLRPAVVVAGWSVGCANLVVTLDGTNDRDVLDASRDTRGWQVWVTSVSEGEAVGQFRYPAAPALPAPAHPPAAPADPEPAPAPAKPKKAKG